MLIAVRSGSLTRTCRGGTRSTCSIRTLRDTRHASKARRAFLGSTAGAPPRTAGAPASHHVVGSRRQHRAASAAGEDRRARERCTSSSSARDRFRRCRGAGRQARPVLLARELTRASEPASEGRGPSRPSPSDHIVVGREPRPTSWTTARTRERDRARASAARRRRARSCPRGARRRARPAVCRRG
jgi:hypothetical protein